MGAILEEHESLNDKWRLGHTKVFFRAGTIGILEEIRDIKIKAIVNIIQAVCRRYVGIKAYKNVVFKKEMIPVIQRNFRKFMFFRDLQWYGLVNGTKRFIGQRSLEDELAELEAEAALHCSEYDNQKALRDEFVEANNGMTKEIKEAMDAIGKSQGDLTSYQAEFSKVQSQKSDLEVRDVGEKKRQFENDLGGIRKDIEDVQMAVQKASQEKSNKEHTIRNMNDEIANQDELINKLNKEKKHAQETQAKQSEELGSAEEKVEHLNKIKAKLEQTLDELEDSLEREKKSRLDVDKNRRKTESELKICHEQVSDLERAKKRP